MRYCLSGNDWKIRQDNKSTTMPGHVPGIVQWDLIENKKTTDFWFGEGPKDKYDACQHDWEYIKEFEVTEDQLADRYTLVFESVDFTCHVYLNGKFVGENNGEYILFRLDVTDVIKAPGKNVLSVKIDKMPPELLDYLIKSDGKCSGANPDDMTYWFVNAMNVTRQTLKGLKNIATYSYDWSTNLYALGIPADVYLETTSKARIDWTKYLYEFTEGYKQVSVNFEIEADASADTDAVAEFTISGHGDPVTVTKKVKLKKGNNVIDSTLTIDDPKLWYPIGYGDQPLYTATAKIYINGVLSDEKTEKIGMRDIKWGQCEGLEENFIHPFALYINGVLIRSYGSCFETIDAMKGREGKFMQEYLVELAKRGSFNVFRLHGGQTIYYKDFHDYCDEHGMMLFVDFPLGNCVPECEPDMLEMYRFTLTNYMKRLRSHASIIEWAGGNELGWHTDPYLSIPSLDLMREVAKECDPQRLFRNTCPVVGSRHGHYDYNPDNHYEEYNAMLMDNCNYAPMQRNGEFSCSSPANADIWYKYIPEKDRFPIDPESPSLIRKNVTYSVDDFLWLNKDMIERMFGPCNTLEKLLRAGQFLAGEGLRYAMDTFRSRGKRFSGFTTWCYNEPAPNGAACGLVDYEGQPYHAFYMTKEAMDQVSICLKMDSIFYSTCNDSNVDVIVNSDWPETLKDLKWEWVLRNRRGVVYGKNAGLVTIDPVTCVKVDTVKINPPIEMKLGPVFLELRLYKNGEIISERVQVFAMKGIKKPLLGFIEKNTPDDDFGIPYTTTGRTGGGIKQTELAITLVEKSCCKQVYKVENTGEQIALYCQIKPLTKHIPTLFIDKNYVSIPPKSSRLITIESMGEDFANSGFTFEAFNTPKYEIASENTVLYMSRCDETNVFYAKSSDKKSFKADGIKVDETKVGYICDDYFEATFKGSKGACEVNFAVTDAAKSSAKITIELNGVAKTFKLASGYGLKKNDFDILCKGEQVKLVFDNALKSGNNTVKVTVESGWFAWDALSINKI